MRQRIANRTETRQYLGYTIEAAPQGGWMVEGTWYLILDNAKAAIRELSEQPARKSKHR